MKKKIITLIVGTTILVSVLGACGVQETSSGINNAETVQTESEEQKIEQKENVQVTEEEELNEEILLTLEAKHTTYYVDGEVDSSEERQYDEYGNLTKIIVDSQEVTFEYEYEGQNVVRCIAGSNGEMVVCREYNEEDNTIKDTFYDTDGTPLLFNEYQYDSNGNLMSKSIYYAKDNILAEQFLYDENGNILKHICSLTLLVEYEYDTNGNIIKQTMYGEDGAVITSQQYEYEYDSFGNKTKCVEYDSRGEVQQQEEWKYDANGNLVECIIYHGSVIHEKIEYTVVSVNTNMVPINLDIILYGYSGKAY